MSSSIIVKVIIILLVIVGIMQLTAQNAVEKQIQKNAEEVAKAQQQYNERLKKHRTEKQKISGNLIEQRERHYLLTRLGGPLSRIRNSVLQYERKHDTMPEGMTDLGLNSEKAADGKYIQSIKIDNGEIYAFLTEKYGSNKIVRLYDDPGGFTWKCDTNLRLSKKITIASAPCTEESDITFNGRYIQ